MRTRIMNEDDPAKSQEYGRDVGKQSGTQFDQRKWDNVKERIVYTCNFHKFTQNIILKAELLKHGTLKFAEASKSDGTWGIEMSLDNPQIGKSKWRGKNLLGEIITAVRDEIVSRNLY